METCFRDAGPDGGLFAGTYRISEKRGISQKVQGRIPSNECGHDTLSAPP
jgi:hypothetical protein